MITQLADHRVEVRPGRGTVVRCADAAAWVGPDASAGALSAVVELVTALPAGEAPEDLARRLAGTSPAASPPVAVVVAGPDGFSVALLGAVGLRATDGTEVGGTEVGGTADGGTQTGSRPPNAVVATVAAGSGISIGPGGPAEQPLGSSDTPLDLRDGVVPGGGVQIWRIAAAIPDPGESTNELPGSHAPVAAPPAADVHPIAAPSQGVLHFDDGTTYALDSAYVLGRAPEVHGEVAAGRARAIVLSDSEHLISRAHAKIERQAAGVMVSDLGSANGTFAWNPGDPQWVRLAPHEPAALAPGGRVAIGRRTLAYESSAGS